ncbi:hypothetical protein CDES_14505 (plasmid) [Corynebacterium deserti GIMN1.010]|uniref:Uncharacterized protein n=1 Tax=Corynebacterium deserti GIMN1.010 TaxID=931089 RepID=A0A0M4CIJ9_9CORY|nr:hypothetical protein CDES_14505 [Corynebacterium deserti GIMN1.010]
MPQSSKQGISQDNYELLEQRPGVLNRLVMGPIGLDRRGNHHQFVSQGCQRAGGVCGNGHHLGAGCLGLLGDGDNRPRCPGTAGRNQYIADSD